MSYPTINLIQTGENIKFALYKKGISISQLKEYLGFNNTNSIYKWLRGDSMPTLDNMYAISELLQIPINELIVKNI